MKKYIVFALFLVFFCGVSKAENPIMQTHFGPDPAPMVYNGTVYSYVGDDIPGTDFYYMTKWRVLSTTDMVNWTDHGSPISLESFKWARDRAWAAQCIERNGKFYWYICAQSTKNDMAIGVAVSDSPTGPFKDALGKPLIMNGSWSNIDPTVWIDDDGQAYLYWGNGSLFYVKLNKDMISYSGDIVTVPVTVESFGGTRGNKSVENPNKDMYVEGPWFYKRNNLYYMMYAGMGKGGECLSYSTSNGPTGPWKYQGKIMENQKLNSFTNHGGIIDYKGNSYLFYHSGLLPNGGSYGRAACVEQFTYNPDGTIPAVTATKEGPKPVGFIDPYKRQEAETMAWSEKCTISQNDKLGVYVSSTRLKGYIKVREVNFGNQSPKSFTATLAAGVDGGVLEARLDSVGGPLIAFVTLPRTGGWDKFVSFTSNLSKEVTGTHDVYFYFNGQNITAGRELFNFDWWKFNQK
ncbi:glycoside hydrolase family 43 protein [Paludibacter jiangxiensis]|uniref:Carbohydrate binding module, family 6 n=1 Tax=Paludibacter jiangxiensis TaxID=681398 RepID=A0A171AA44_9BACT|nr:glycoside hydrolase family 43 protein [Paludibacter jiangxiensis]GAT63438.1 carbohydrate binding module, family 6 [Paludibacter jiangxiensis]